MDNNKRQIWKISIADTFCEWEFYLRGGEKYSIQDLVDIVRLHTGMQLIDERLVKTSDTPGEIEIPDEE